MYGDKIRTIRELRNFSQEYMAAELGIAQNTYSKIETGQTKLSADMLKQVSEILGVSPVDILSNHPAIVNFGSSQHLNMNDQVFAEKHSGLFEKMIASKDGEIQYLREIISGLIRDKEAILKFLEK